MFVAVGVGAYAAGVFHVFTHAFFKALLFLAAGSVIHALDGEQDMRRMGGLGAPHEGRPAPRADRRPWRSRACRCCRASSARTRSSAGAWGSTLVEDFGGTALFVLLLGDGRR